MTSRRWDQSSSDSRELDGSYDPLTGRKTTPVSFDQLTMKDTHTVYNTAEQLILVSKLTCGWKQYHLVAEKKT